MGCISVKRKPNNGNLPQEIILENVHFKWFLGLIGDKLEKIKKKHTQKPNWSLYYSVLFENCSSKGRQCCRDYNFAGIAAFPNGRLLIPHSLSKACCEPEVRLVHDFGTHLWDTRKLWTISVVVSIILSSILGIPVGLQYWDLFPGELPEACNHMPAGSSDMAPPALSGYVGDNILGRDRSTDLESYQLDLDAGAATGKVHDLGWFYFTALFSYV